MENLDLSAPSALEAEVFICGAGHSGTSLLANMFAAHPHVYIPLAETLVFDEGRDAVAGLSQLRKEARAAGARYLVEKTPRHVRRLDAIRYHTPTARFVIAVRDGRDVVASVVRRKAGKKVAAAVRHWIHDNAIANEERGSPDVHVYRHEDMVADPQGTLMRICDFATIPFDPEMLDYHRQQRLWRGQSEVRPGDGVGRQQHEALRNWQVSQPIFDSSGRWRTELSSKDLAPLKVGSGRQLMEAFGYLPPSRRRLHGLGVLLRRRADDTSRCPS